MEQFINPVDVKEMGRRFKLVRQRLGLTQVKVANVLGTSQLMVFRVEKGENVLTPLFLSMLMYYSQFLSLDGLMSKHFDIEDESLFNKNYSLNSLVKSRLEMLRQDVVTKIDNVQRQLDVELEATTKLL